MPVRLKAKYRFTEKGVGDWLTHVQEHSRGSVLNLLRKTTDDNIFICDSDDDVYLVQRGRCAYLGEEETLAGQGVMNMEVGGADLLQ